MRPSPQALTHAKEVSRWHELNHYSIAPITRSTIARDQSLRTKEQLRDQGVRVSLVPIREITEKAQQYLADHPEVYAQALERARQLGMIEIREPIVTPDAKRSR